MVVAGSRIVWSITTGRVCRNTLASARGSPSGHCKNCPYPSQFVAVPPTLDIGLPQGGQDMVPSNNSNEFWIPIFMKFLQFYGPRSSAWILQQFKELFLGGIRQTVSLNKTPKKSPGLTEENDNVSAQQDTCCAESKPKLMQQNVDSHSNRASVLALIYNHILWSPAFRKCLISFGCIMPKMLCFSLGGQIKSGSWLKQGPWCHCAILHDELLLPAENWKIAI